MLMKRSNGSGSYASPIAEGGAHAHPLLRDHEGGSFANGYLIKVGSLHVCGPFLSAAAQDRRAQFSKEN
jgi:hypothetical protein